MRLLPSTLALGLVLLAGCAPKASIYADNAPAETHEVKVLSADRLVIDGQKITLADAEAPHPAGQAGCRGEAIAAVHAADTVRSMLASARHVEVHPSDQGGDLRLVNLDGLDLGQTLISQGLAVSRQPVAMDWCVRSDAMIERVARIDAPGVQQP